MPPQTTPIRTKGREEAQLLGNVVCLGTSTGCLERPSLNTTAPTPLGGFPETSCDFSSPVDLPHLVYSVTWVPTSLIIPVHSLGAKLTKTFKEKEKVFGFECWLHGPQGRDFLLPGSQVMPVSIGALNNPL